MKKRGGKMKIYIFTEPTLFGNFRGGALCEDGHLIANWFSRSVEASKFDMGITSNIHHYEYSIYCPTGYKLEWIDYENLLSHTGWLKAMKRNYDKRTRLRCGIFLPQTLISDIKSLVEVEIEKLNNHDKKRSWRG